MNRHLHIIFHPPRPTAEAVAIVRKLNPQPGRYLIQFNRNGLAIAATIYQ